MFLRVHRGTVGPRGCIFQEGSGSQSCQSRGKTRECRYGLHYLYCTGSHKEQPTVWPIHTIQCSTVPLIRNRSISSFPINTSWTCSDAGPKPCTVQVQYYSVPFHTITRGETTAKLFFEMSTCWAERRSPTVAKYSSIAAVWRTYNILWPPRCATRQVDKKKGKYRIIWNTADTAWAYKMIVYRVSYGFFIDRTETSNCFTNFARSWYRIWKMFFMV